MHLNLRDADKVQIGETINNQTTVNNNQTHITAKTYIAQTIQQASRSRDGLARRLRLIDRVHESDALRGQILTRPSQARAPFVACLVGLPEDGMPVFVGRFADYEMEEKLALSCDYLGLLEWPETSLRTLIVELNGKLARLRGRKGPRALERDELARLVQDHGRSLCFGHVLRPAACLARPDILEDWFAIFASDWPVDLGDNLLICLLCVDLGGASDQQAQELLAKLAALSKKYTLHVLPACAAVQRSHLEDWVNAYNAKPEEGEPSYLSTAFVDRVFAHETALRFERVREGAAQEFNLPH